MNKPPDNMIELCESLMAIRKNSLLLLDLKDIRQRSCLKLYEEVQGKHYEKLDVILQTPGGDIDSAFNIAKLLRALADNVTIIVPLYAKSAGTLVCLASDVILMTSLSELGPLDTQIREDQEGTSPTYSSALNGFKALEQVQIHTLETLDIATKLILQRSGMKMAEAIKLATEFSGNTSGTLYRQLDPKKIGEYARALEIGERYGIMILTRHMGWAEDKATDLIRKLVKSYPNHGFVIDCEELKLLGLPSQYSAPAEETLLHALRLSLLNSKNTTMKLMEYSEPHEEPAHADA